MTETKPTIEEQIWVMERVADGILPHSSREAILASLRELAAIKNQPVPVEPVAYAAMINGEIAWDADYPFSNEPFTCFDDEQAAPLYPQSAIDTLQSALQAAQQERGAKDRLLKDYEEWLSVQGEGSAELVKRAEQAESRNKRMVELLKEPSKEVIKNCARRLLRFQDDSTDESFSALQWAEVKQDAERVIAELYAELLREVDNGQ